MSYQGIRREPIVDVTQGDGDVGPAWRLTAGRFHNVAGAAEACGVLRDAGLACDVARRDGAMLAQP